MRMIVAFLAMLLATPAAFGRVSQPLGRQPKVQNHLPKEPRLWQDREGIFAISRPDGERWAFRSGSERCAFASRVRFKPIGSPPFPRGEDRAHPRADS